MQAFPTVTWRGPRLWRRGRLDESGLYQHVTVWCHLPSGIDTATSYRITTTDGRNTTIGCQSTDFPTHGLNYSRVCGRLRGYQYGGPDAFYRTYSGQSTSVDTNYLDGASITYGSNPRTHVWTYAVGTRSYSLNIFNCPCNSGSYYQVPSFLGSDYYCESGVASGFPYVKIFNDLLWDGQQCTSLEGPCCTQSNMPWFNKTLSETTTENIELRLCGDDSPTADEDVLLELIELYVK